MNACGTVLVFNYNVSGMNRFLFRELKTEWNLIVEDIPHPVLPRYVLAALSFHPRKATWKKRYGLALTRYHTSAPCFRTRSRYARRVAANHAEFDIAFQIGGLFNGLAAVRGRPRATFASFNMCLSRREWPPWAPFRSDAAYRQWLELEKELYVQTDHLLCTNRYVMRSFEQDYGIPPEKLHYIGYGINFDVLPDVKKTYRSRLALFVGYDFQRKGGPTVVEAFRLARKDFPDARLRIIGPTQLSAEYLVEGVEFVPRLADRAALQRHFTEADFFVMPSLCEPFGLVFLEAMAHKNACIGSTNNAMPEIIEHGRTGYVVEPGNAEALAEYMRRLFGNEDLRREMGDASLQRVQEHFTWAACGARVREVFRTMRSGA